MPKTPGSSLGPDDIVLARRRVGWGLVSLGPDQPWPEGGTIPMRLQEALEREDCDPVDEAGNVIVVELSPGPPAEDHQQEA